MSDVEDSGEGLWGRTEQHEFTYAVTVPGIVEKVSLTAVQDRDMCAGTPAFPSHGHCVWDAALLLADYLQTKAQQPTAGMFQGKKVVELGAGVGLVGMTLAVFGAQVTLTDQEYALPLLGKNVAINFVGDSNSATIAASVPTVEECQWGEPFKAGGTLSTWKKNTDVVVFSDVLYHASAFLLLIKMLHELVSPATQVYFSFETRDATIEATFLQELGKTFVIEEVSHQENNQVFAKFEYPDELFIYYARLKTNGNDYSVESL
ncbi:hypothetical protein DVH05_005877 [Phytophthora capsici]|nr:hypothetical protein DVH05_005877 [Phytophthora capsici]